MLVVVSYDVPDDRRRLKLAGWGEVDALRWRCVEADLLAQGRRDARSAGMYRW